MSKWIAVILCLVSVASAAEPIRIVVENADGTQRVFVPEASPPPVPEPRTNWGINLAPVRYWGTERVFTDLSKQSSTWNWCAGWGWNNTPAFPQDANGYPSSVPSGSHAAQILDAHAGLFGEYVVSPLDGVSVDGAPSGVLRFATDNQRMLLRVRAGITALSIREQSADPDELFYPPFVARTRQFGILRFMDWGQTNEARPITWASRVTPSWYTQADREVCWEYQLRLAMLCDADAWLCVHHQSDDEYVRQVAKLVKAEWKGKRKIYLEHSNETWNAQFPANRWCIERSPVTRHALEYHLKRTAEIADIFAAEGVEVVSVLGAQAAGLPPFKWVVAQLGPFPKQIDAIAIAPYFGGSVSSTAKLAGPVQILAECRADLQVVRGQVRGWKTFCDEAGVTLLAYEGGQHVTPLGGELSNTTIIDNCIAANRDEQMGAIYGEYMRAWDEDTGKAPHCLFHSVSRPTKWGSWGLQEYEGDTGRSKYRAVMGHMGLAP